MPWVWGWQGMAAGVLCVSGQHEMRLPGFALKFLFLFSRTSPFSLNFRYKKHFPPPPPSFFKETLTEIEVLASRSGTTLIPKCKRWEGDGITVMTADKHL